MRTSVLLLWMACDPSGGVDADGSAARGALAAAKGPSSLVLFLSAIGVPTLAEEAPITTHNFIGGVEVNDDIDFTTTEGRSDGSATAAMLVLLGPTLLTGQTCLIGTATDDTDFMSCSVQRHPDGSRTIDVSVTDDMDVYSRVSGGDDFDYTGLTEVHRAVDQSWSIEIDPAGGVYGSTSYEVGTTRTLSEPDLFDVPAVGAGPTGPAFCDHLGGECVNRPDGQDCAAATCSLAVDEAFRAEATFEGFLLDGSMWSSFSKGGRVDDDDDPSWGFQSSVQAAYPNVVFGDDIDSVSGL
jgi:hypothetical protein